MASLFFNQTHRVGLFKRFCYTLCGHYKKPLEAVDVQPRILMNAAQNVACQRHLQTVCFYHLQGGLSSGFHEQGLSRIQKPHFRLKSKKVSRSSYDSDGNDSDGSEDEDQEESKDFKVLKGHVNSSRIDTVLKFALGMSRNKVDNAFYSNCIYLNGEKLDKKKQSVAMEDEVDIVKGENSLNPSFIDVQRVEVLDIHHSRTNPDKVAIKVRRFKRLTIDNYDRPWKPTATE